MKKFNFENAYFWWNFKPEMVVTKAFLRKMSLGTFLRKISHFIRIRCQKWIWRPRELHMCLLGARLDRENSRFSKNGKIQDARFSSQMHILANKIF